MHATTTVEIVRVLRNLVQLNDDSAVGLREAAQQISDKNLGRIFQNIAEQREYFSSALGKILHDIGSDDHVNGSLMAAAHRMWLDLRAVLASGNAGVVLKEVERTEDAVKGAYEHALDLDLETSVRSVLTHQFPAIVEAHDRIRDLRDAYLENRS